MKTGIIRYLLIILIIAISSLSFGQSKSKLTKAEMDTLPNWNMNKTYISIDTLYVQKQRIEIDCKTFNYMKSYLPLKYIEYGNVNSKYQPEGLWIYKLADNWTPVSGKALRGYKIGKWGYNCAWVCDIKYRWNIFHTKTNISKKKILYDY